MRLAAWLRSSLDARIKGGRSPKGTFMISCFDSAKWRYGRGRNKVMFTTASMGESDSRQRSGVVLAVGPKGEGESRCGRGSSVWGCCYS